MTLKADKDLPNLVKTSKNSPKTTKGPVRPIKITVGIVCLIFSISCFYGFSSSSIWFSPESQTRAMFWFGGLGALALVEAAYSFITCKDYN